MVHVRFRKKHAYRLVFTRLQVITLLAFLSAITVEAQIRVGQPFGKLDNSASIDISSGPYSTGSTYRGIVPPKVSLTQSSVTAPISNPATGLLIYNTSRIADVTPGYYYWDGNKWQRLAATSAGLSAGDPIPAFTTSQLLTYTTPDIPPSYIMLVEPGREGLFRYEASNNEPTDGAIMLVTINGKHYKRIIDRDYNIMWWGIRGDGVTDEALNIQTAIDYLWNRGGGTLFFPSNYKYRISNTITIKENVKLKGADFINFNDLEKTPCQFIITTPPDSTKPAFIMAAYSGMEGFGFYYPNQPTANTQPVKYGWAITTSGQSKSQDGIQLRNLMLQNPYLGINLDWGAQHILENIYGNPIKTGLRIDRSYDANHISNIHFWNKWAGRSDTANLTNWIKSNGVAFEIGHTDNSQLTNVLVYGYHTSMWLKQGLDGAPWIQVTNACFDVTDFGIIIDAIYKAQFSNLLVSGRNLINSQDGIIVNKSVNDLGSTLDIFGYQPSNLVNAFRNKGILRVNIIGSARNTTQPVVQYEAVNENDGASISLTSPLRLIDYSRFSGKMTINGARNYDSVIDITPNNFQALINWSVIQRPNLAWTINNTNNNTSLLIPANTTGILSTLGFNIPSQIINEKGLFGLKIKSKVSIPNNGIGALQFYVRLRNFNKGITFNLTPVYNSYYIDNQLLIIPFLYSGGSTNGSDAVFELVYGNNTTPTSISIDVENTIQLIKLSGYNSTYIEVMPKHIGFTNFTPDDIENTAKINPTNSQITGSLTGAALPFNTPIYSYSVSTANWVVGNPVEIIPQNTLVSGHTYDIVANWTKTNADQGIQTWTIPVINQLGGVPAQSNFIGTSHNSAGTASGRYFTMRYGSVTTSNVTPPVQFGISTSDMSAGTVLTIQVFRRN